MDIERVAAENPEAIFKDPIDIRTGIRVINGVLLILGY